ncbi:hypothetical protein [Lysinibacillus xylanilyticus]|uniref:hypothetical protein n=1 Tax=Lysinibacillus xylanilyticus TaxID=582475 RepID=UPI003CFF0F02
MYLILEIINQEFRITHPITEIEFTEYKKISEPIREVKSKVDYFNLIKEEYEEYLSAIDDKKSNSTKFIRVINNYLSSYKGFLDRWETFFKRNGSEELIVYFKSTVSEVYDRCFEYRFFIQFT